MFDEILKMLGNNFFITMTTVLLNNNNTTSMTHSVLMLVVYYAASHCAFKLTNNFHTILRHFDVLPNFPFTTSETMDDYHL